MSVAGGGFVYTNTESVSVGVVLRLDDLTAKGVTLVRRARPLPRAPGDRATDRGGEPLEYGCHLTIENGPVMASHDLTRPGLVVIGDAAGFTLNTGLTIRGMDLAAGSAIAAAVAIDRSLAAGDFSQQAMDGYLAELAASFVGADMRRYARTPAFLENPRLYSDYGRLAADVFRDVYDHDLAPRRSLLGTARAALRRSGARAPVGWSVTAVAALRAL